MATNGTIINASLTRHWFCGDYRSNMIVDPFDMGNDCMVHFLKACLHLLFTALIILVIVVCGCRTQLRNRKVKWLIPFPGHILQWTCVACICIVLFAAIGEGIMMDTSRNDVTQPHLYVPQVSAFIAVNVALVFYHHMEYWNRPNMAWLLVMYWMLGTAAEVVELGSLLTHVSFDVLILRYDIVLFCILLYALCFLVGCHVLRTKVFGCCYEEPSFPPDLQKKNMYNLYRYTNVLSRLMFWSMSWIMVLGNEQPLEIEDLGCLSDEFECNTLHRSFKTAYEVEKKRVLKKKKDTMPSLWRIYFKMHGLTILQANALNFIVETVALIPPLAVGGVVTFASKWYYNEEIPVSNTGYVTVEEFFANGFVLIGVIFVATGMKALILQWAYNMCIFVGIKARTCLQIFTYEKSLRLSSWVLSSGDKTVGQITNHMAVDAMNIRWFSYYQIHVYATPYQVTTILILLYLRLGPAALIGASVFVVATPLQYKIADAMSAIQRIILKFADQRLKKSNELLQGIRLLKLYGWEELFSSRIEVVRNSEVGQMLKSGFLMIWTSFVAQCVPVLVTFISFAVYSAVSPTPLTPEVAFSSLALFNLLVIPMMLIPTTVQVLVNAIVSMDRLQSFFASPEIEKHDNGRPPFDDGLEEDDVANQSRKSGGNLKITDEKTRNLLDNRESSSYGTFETSLSEATIPTTYLPDHLSIQISGGHFAWDIDSDVAILHDIDLEVPIDTLTIIIGMVGAGKSSLLSAILGEMSTLAGNIYFNRKRNIISYCPQRAWLQNSTLRANILFGEPMDHTRYNTILDACALRPDIDILPAGDMTEIGEKGINLSGGQKQRISVARALYNKSDIVLMDDPFSALDVHVGSQLMKEGILGFLKREQRTVILVTHQLQYLKYADTVISMDNCTIADQGNLNEIRKRDPNLYAVWEKRISFLSDSEDDDDSSEETTKLERLKLIEQVTGKHEQHRQDDSAAGTLMEKEEREVGSVSLKVYLSYAKAIKYSLTCLTLLLYVAQGTMLILTNFWLSAWSESGSETANKTQEDLDDELTYYIRGYAALSFSYIGISLVAISCQIMFSLYGARRVHIKLLRNIIHAPMRFFDTTPVGRVLNRFSNDTNIIDQRLWMVMFSILSNASVLISAIVVNAVVSPIFIAGAAPLFLIYILIQRYFISTARELQRLGSISRSPVFAHFSESLEGLTTIRAYRNEKRFRRQLHTSVDTNNIAMVCLTLVNRWMGVRLEFIGAVVVLISGLSGLLTALFGELEPSLVGLALTYALSISGHSAILVRSTADCEMQMNAVERIRYYTNVESEQYEGVYNPPPDWPTDGDIKIENISVRYDPSLEPVLRDVSIHFKGGQRVGICGRTGSGKSSLAASLFQIVDTFKGRILIDGVDISHIPLLTLRKRLSIIPQDPVLFQGTIRFNLDPENLRSDDEIWEALEIAQLKQVVTELDMQLDADISEDGVNFSLGQRQLFCIARAFLRKSRILLMDEATASIDLKTDKLLQDVVATAFADRTVITIAHRISTILDSDTVVVLSDGRVVEYDTPENLLKKEDGIFASFVQGSLDN